MKKTKLLGIICIILMLTMVFGCTQTKQEDSQEEDYNTIVQEIQDIKEVSEPEVVSEKQEITVTPVEEESEVVITKPEEEIGPEVEITKEENIEEPEEYVLTEEELAKLEDKKLTAERVYLPSAFMKLNVGETYVFGIKVKNVYHYDSIFGVRVASYLGEQKEGMSFTEVPYPRNVEKWFKNNDFKRFAIERNSDKIIPIAIEVGSTFKDGVPVQPGSRITYNLEIYQMDETGKEIDIYGYKKIVIRVI